VIHYHGTPITPRATLLQLAGRSFCVSFSAPRDVEVCHEIGESVMLDNGAFSFWTTGRAVDWQRFYGWVEPWLAYHTSWAVIPDVIDGDARANDRLLKGWPFGERGAPVWHPHEPLARLGRLAARWPRVCIGGSSAFAAIRSQRWHARMHEAMDYLCGSGPAPTWLHLLRGMALAGSDYPLSSVDSSSVARNHHGAPSRGTPRRDPLRDIAKTDARQCPARWRPAAPQLALLGDDDRAHEEAPGRDCVAPAWSAGPRRVAAQR